MTRKSGASRLVSTTKRSPQWSTPYSRSGVRGRTERSSAAGSPAGISHTSVLVLLAVVMTIHSSLRVADTSR